jgi:hypothetical protein
LTINYKNPYPGSDCSLASGGLCLNAPLRDWIRIYTPAGSTIVSSNGTQSPATGKAEAMTTLTDLGKTVFNGFLIVNPLGTAQLTLTYNSPVQEADGKYKLLVQRQSGSSDQDFTLTVNGRTVANQKLLTDTEFTY